MPIYTEHPEYKQWVEQAQVMRACIAGERAVKELGTKLLPALEGATRDDYEAYKNRASYFNATRRTLMAVHGNVFRRGSVITLPDDMLDWAEAVTQDGLSLEEFIMLVAREVLSVGRCGVLVDWDNERNAPVFNLYAGENITNWFDTPGTNGAQPEAIVLKEVVDIGSERDPYSHNFVTQLRAIRVVDGVVVSEVWRHRGDRWKPVPELTSTPTVRGQAMSQIPWVWFGNGNNTSEATDSLLSDLASLNAKHYASSADLAHALHFTALPTPYITGLERGETGDEQTQTWRIGSPVAWSLPEGATVGMLEFKGAGVSAIRDDLRDKEARMAVLGAKLVGTLPATNSTATEWTFLNAAEQGALTSFINHMESGFERLLEWAGIFSNSTFGTPISVDIPRDTNSQPLTPEQLEKLYNVLRAGGISLDTYLGALERGELLPANFDFYSERERLQSVIAGPVAPELARNQETTVQKLPDNPLR
jgi:hypothetical protein